MWFARKEVNKMDERNKALNQESEENTPDTTPVPEETTEEVIETPTEPTGEVEEEVAETEEKPKKGYSARVQELNTRAKQAEEKAQSLAERLAELTGSVEPPTDFSQNQPQEEPIISPGEEIDAIELETRLKAREQRFIQKADAIVQLRNKQNDAVNRINSEANEALRKYPQLDPDNDSYNPKLSKAITKAVEAHVLGNPYTASVSKFVKELMVPYEEGVTQEVGKAQEGLAKQVSQAAQRPTAIRQNEKQDSDLTEKELEDKYGVVIS